MTKMQTKNSLRAKQEIAKVGMTASLGILTISAFMLKNRAAKKLHVTAGVALIGFSYWHYKLNQPQKVEQSKKQTV